MNFYNSQTMDVRYYQEFSPIQQSVQSSDHRHNITPRYELIHPCYMSPNVMSNLCYQRVIPGLHRFHSDPEQNHANISELILPTANSSPEVKFQSRDVTMAGTCLQSPYDAFYSPLDCRHIGYRKNVTKETTGPLKSWLVEHRKNPYPTKAEKIMLAIITKMTMTQVSTWFANARRRLKKETTDEHSQQSSELSGIQEISMDKSGIALNMEDSPHSQSLSEDEIEDDEDMTVRCSQTFLPINQCFDGKSISPLPSVTPTLYRSPTKLCYVTPYLHSIHSRTKGLLDSSPRNESDVFKRDSRFCNFEYESKSTGSNDTKFCMENSTNNTFDSNLLLQKKCRCENRLTEDLGIVKDRPSRQRSAKEVSDNSPGSSFPLHQDESIKAIWSISSILGL